MTKGRKRKLDPKLVPEWGRRLKLARDKAGFSQERLGALIQKSQSQIGAYETGESNPDISVWIRIGDILKVSPSWLVFGEGAPDDGDPLVGATLTRYENDRLFAFTMAQASRALAEEGFDADLPFMINYSLKLLSAGQHATDDSQAKNLIAAALDADRAELRRDLHDIRARRLKPE